LTIRLLIVEDSPVQREVLRYVLEESGAFEIVGTAGDGQEAVEMTEQLRPDIVLMDCHMPKVGGIEATRRIMGRCPTPIVIVSASLQPDDVELTFDAIKSGALAVLAKPIALTSPGNDQAANEMITTLKLMSEVTVVGRRFTAREATLTSLQPPQRPVRLIAIGGSTGAPGVVADLLAATGQGKPPILIVQHMARGFVSGFAGWLAARSGLTVVVAEHAQQCLPGTVYVAPDDAHLGVRRDGRIHLDQEVLEEGFRPSVSHLFRSVAGAYGPDALGILLTGMGRDGASGLLEMHRAGALTAAQDEDSSVVFGMPREAIRLGAAQHVLPPADLAALIKASTLKEKEGGLIHGRQS
jgi:two-component system chemotaxis response regulator CheB